MRPKVTVFVVVVLSAAAGCSKSSKPTGVLTTSAGLRVSWPGTPEESGAGTAYYMAMYADRAPGQVTLYMASVTDLGPAAAEMPARDHLVAFKFAFQKDELSRKEIEHGPKKRAGFDIVSKRSGKVSREVVVAAATRIYSVSVTCPTEEALRAPQVRAFFDSFAVEE